MKCSTSGCINNADYKGLCIRCYNRERHRKLARERKAIATSNFTPDFTPIPTQKWRDKRD